MVRLNFSGAINDVRARQLEFISEILENNGFKGPDVIIENVGAVDDNYVANVKRIVVTENGTTFKMIAKLAPEHEILRYMVQIAMLFKNEHVIYTELFPKFLDIQKRARIPENELLRYAKCYGSLSEAPNEIILLEDLRESKFDILDKFKALTNDTVKLVLKNLAIYHSLSYALKHQESETFEEIKSKLTDTFGNTARRPEEIEKYMLHLEKITLTILTDDRYKNVVKGSMSEVFYLNAELSKTDIGNKYSVIQQGDGWTNNIMFTCQNDIPIECVLIDYQMARENNPCYDLMYFLFNSTTHEQRLKSYHEFIDYYHTELDISLHNYGLKATHVYPRDQLDYDLKRYGKLMFAMSIMVSNFTLKKSDDAAKMKEAMINVTEDNIDESIESVFDLNPEIAILYKSKIEGLVDSFTCFGLL